VSNETTYTIDRMAFPVLCLARDTSITVAMTGEELDECNARAFFINRYFEDLVILDSNAHRYRVARAVTAERMSTVRTFLVRAFNRRLIVDLDLRREEDGSVALAKKLVLEWVRKAPDHWESSRDLPEWESMIGEAPDMGTLIGLFK
jgi:hypothetical protein